MNTDNSSRADLLLVDDDVDVRDVIETAGEMAGLVVASFPNGQAALEQFPELEPRFTIIDYALGSGEINGAQIGQQIRSLPGGEETMLILLSGDLNENIASEAQQAGFEKLLRKPISMSELLHLLE